MRKPKRNEPCSCGSGKKYKRCCGANTNNSSNVQTMNDTLYRIHQDLISFATNKYNITLQEQLTLLDSPAIMDEDTKDIYQIGLTPWIVATTPCLNNKDTIFERFYRQNQARVSPLAKSILVKWPRTLPSVYEIISIDSPKRNFLQIRELRTMETFDVPFERANSNFTEGGLLIGMLIPFVQHDNFLFSMVTLYDRDTNFYIELLDTYSKKDGGLKGNFPQFLQEALQSGATEFVWEHPQHEEVANLFAEKMETNEIDDDTIGIGITLWNDFCKKENPTIQKTEPYAAALDFYIQKEVLQKPDVRQVQVAEQYDTSPSTLSRIYRNMVNVLQTD